MRQVTGQGWGSVRADLEADVRRVADRLRNLSAARLAAPPVPPEGRWPPYRSCAQAARAVAGELAAAALALEAEAEGLEYKGHVVLPELSDFAVADQVSVTGHDLLTAMDRVPPDALVRTDFSTQVPAAAAVAQAARLLADVRRRI